MQDGIGRLAANIGSVERVYFLMSDAVDHLTTHYKEQPRRQAMIDIPEVLNLEWRACMN